MFCLRFYVTLQKIMFMKKIIVACVVALCANITTMAVNKTTAKNVKPKNGTITLHVVETSDIHGSFFPYDFINRTPKKGSLARVSSYVKKLRTEKGNENIVLLDNGDILQGQPTCYFYNYVNTKETNIAAEVINYLNYDAESMGNHDVEPGHAVFDKWISEVKCPMLGANIIDAKTNKPYVKPYTILNKNGVKVAVIGMLTPAIPNWLQPEIWSGMRFDDMVETARKWVKYVKENEKPDVIIGLFHSGTEGGIITNGAMEDASLVVPREVPGFDLVLFGHDHTRHNGYETSIDGSKTLCLDPANNAISVSKAEISLTFKKGKLVKKNVTGNIVDVINEPIDEEFMNHFKPQIEKVNKFVDKPIGTFAHTIYTRDSFFGSCAFVDLIHNLQLQITGADISFNAPLQFDAVVKAGTIRVSDMFNLYKFENMLYVMNLTGEEIRKHLEMSYDQWVNTMKSANDHLMLLGDTRGDAQRLGFKNMTFNFDSAAGIIYEVDVTKPDGEKVKIKSMADGTPFDEKKWYKVALNSYRANGGGELLTKGAGIPQDSLENRIVWRSDRDQRHYLMKEIEKAGTLDPQPNNNWKFVPEKWTKPAAQRDRELLFAK